MAGVERRRRDFVAFLEDVTSLPPDSPREDSDAKGVAHEVPVETSPEANHDSSAQRWLRASLAPLGAVLLWCAFPPLKLWPLAWVGLVCWVSLIPKNHATRVGFPRRAIWFSSFGYWLAMNYFVTLPHWAGIFGWLAMSAYLAIYLPLFLWFAGALRRSFRLPIWIAAPIAWAAMEFLRGHLLTGYGVGMLPHCMYEVPLLIQAADWIGGYGISCLMVATAGGIVETIVRRNWVGIVAALIPVAALVGYGWFRLSEVDISDRHLVVGMIQGSRDVVFGLTADAQQTEMMREFEQYHELTLEARHRWPDLELILWPEGAFPATIYLAGNEGKGLTENEREFLQDARQYVRDFWLAGVGLQPVRGDEDFSKLLDDAIPLLTGANCVDIQTQEYFNSAVLFDRWGDWVDRYDKMHLVMFGEYVPLGTWFPIVYRWTPIPGALTAGTVPRSFSLGAFRIAPNICFESTDATLIRQQVVTLARNGAEPDLLVNLTNDGWFYGSSCLDLHLACNVFRAVELRKPVCVAANTGFSAQIDDRGRILARGPRRQTALLRAEVAPSNLVSPYRILGDWPALILTLIAAVSGVMLLRAKGKDSGN